MLKNFEYDENAEKRIDKKEFIKMIPLKINNERMNGFPNTVITKTLKLIVKGIDYNERKPFYSHIKLKNK